METTIHEDNSDVAFENLQLTLDRNKILTREDPGFHEARSLWNGMIDRKPLCIIQCRNADDVIAAVKFAKDNQLTVSVKGGGHNVAGNAVCLDGVMIDLSPMKKIEVDEQRKIAFVEPGVILREMDAATQKYNLATTGGTVSDTGIAGLTLGGGLGWLMGKHGTASDNLLSVDIVTAEGELLHADTDHYEDLFWAIRGGGGNFGIITRFEYQLHDFGPTLYAGMILYPMEQAMEVLSHFRKYIREAPDELMSYSGFIVTPEGMPVTFILPAWMGANDQAEQHLAPLRSFGQPIADMVTEMPYTSLQSILDAAAPKGLRRYWKSGHFTELSDEVLKICLDYVATRPSPYSPVLFFHVRGEATRIDPAATAFNYRKDHWDANIIGQWIEVQDDETNIQWVRNFWDALAPHADGVYVNHLDTDDSQRIASAYGDNFPKLKQIKRKYDPENFFRMNNNILPA